MFTETTMSSFSSRLDRVVYSLHTPRPYIHTQSGSRHASLLPDTEHPGTLADKGPYRSALFASLLREMVVCGRYPRALVLIALLPQACRRPVDELCAALAYAGMHQEKEAAGCFLAALQISPSAFFTARILTEYARMLLCCRRFEEVQSVLHRAALFLKQSQVPDFLLQKLQAKAALLDAWTDYEAGRRENSLQSALAILPIARRHALTDILVHAWRLISRLFLSLDGLQTARAANANAYRAIRDLDESAQPFFEAVVLCDRSILYGSQASAQNAFDLLCHALFLTDSIEAEESGELVHLRLELLIRLGEFYQKSQCHEAMHETLQQIHSELFRLPLALSLHMQARSEAILAASLLEGTGDLHAFYRRFESACHHHQAAMGASARFSGRHLSQLIYRVQSRFSPSAHPKLFKEELSVMVLSQFDACKHKYPRFYLSAIAEMEARRGLFCYLSGSYRDAVSCFMRSIERYDDYLQLFPDDLHVCCNQLVSRINLIEAMEIEELQQRGEKQIRLCFEGFRKLRGHRLYMSNVTRMVEQLMSSEQTGVLFSKLLEDEYLEFKGYSNLSDQALIEQFDA